MMEGKGASLPDRKNYEYAHDLAYKLASEQLAGIKDIAEQCRRSGAHYRQSASRCEIIVRFLNRSYIITFPDARISLEGSIEEVPLRERILILHYFISARGTLLANRLITFRELPEGNIYYPTFLQRTVKPLLNKFGQEPRRLLEAGEKLGARRADYGDAALTIDAFSRLPLTIILWRGDDELAPQGSVAFDATISDYLPTEDITVLCETIAWKLVRSAG